MNAYLDISPEVKQAIAEGKPVVALESTIISHGMRFVAVDEDYVCAAVSQIGSENAACCA